MDRYYKEPFAWGPESDNPGSFTLELWRRRIKGNLPITGYLNDKKQKYGRKNMKIEFDRFEKTTTNPNASGKTFPIYRVFGTALSGKSEGQEYSTTFFASARDMVQQVGALQKGDVVNITMAKNGNYWNPQKFEKVEDNVNTNATVPVQSSGACSCEMSKSDKRFKNLKLAAEMLGPKPTKLNETEHMLTVASVADMIQDYMDKRGPFQFDDTKKEGVPEEDDAQEIE
jgi:hypothetical protein